MKYTLTVTETGKKDGKFHYQVIDENGKVISERRSNREYVACTINGTFYFGRLDLIGKAEHATHIKRCAGWGWDARTNKMVPGMHEPTEQTPIAYLASK